MKRKHIENAKIFKAFCDENRLLILELLQEGEQCTCVLQEQVDIAQSTISHHMKILVESGIVNARKDGKWTYYSINEDGTEYACQLLESLTLVSENNQVKEHDACL